MSKRKKVRPACVPAAELDAQIESIAILRIDDLRAAWEDAFARALPVGFTKDLIARALTYRIQEASLGGLSARTHRILRDLGKGGVEPTRQVKVGSVIVREHGGNLHEVSVVPGGFLWQGQTYTSLSIIAKAITGTTWNGPRFFGLRGKCNQAEAREIKVAGDASETIRLGRRSSIGSHKRIEMRGRTRIDGTASNEQSS